MVRPSRGAAISPRKPPVDPPLSGTCPGARGVQSGPLWASSTRLPQPDGGAAMVSRPKGRRGRLCPLGYAIASSSAASSGKGATATSSSPTSGPGAASTRAVTSASQPSSSRTTSPGSTFGAGCSMSPRSSPCDRVRGRLARLPTNLACRTLPSSRREEREGRDPDQRPVASLFCSARGSGSV